MADLDLDALEALLAQATPGEWRACGTDRGGCQCGFVWGAEPDVVIAKALNEQPDGSLGADAQKANALLIAAMHNALPGLIAEVRESRAGLSRIAACLGAQPPITLAQVAETLAEQALVLRARLSENTTLTAEVQMLRAERQCLIQELSDDDD